MALCPPINELAMPVKTDFDIIVALGLMPCPETGWMDNSSCSSTTTHVDAINRGVRISRRNIYVYVDTSLMAIFTKHENMLVIYYWYLKAYIINNIYGVRMTMHSFMKDMELWSYGDDRLRLDSDESPAVWYVEGLIFNRCRPVLVKVWRIVRA